MKILLTILVLMALGQFMSCGLFSGCDPKNPLIVMSFESKQWMPYQQGQILKFENETRTDTVIVSTYIEAVESFFKGDECPDGMMQIVKVRLTSKLFEDSIKFKIEDRYRVLLENEGIALEFDEGNTTLRGKDFSPAYHETLKIRNKDFVEVLVSTCDTCDDLKEIVFAKNVGLIAFKTKTGEHWVKE